MNATQGIWQILLQIWSFPDGEIVEPMPYKHNNLLYETFISVEQSLIKKTINSNLSLLHEEMIPIVRS